MDGTRSRKETALKHVRTGKRLAEKEEGDDRMPEEDQALSPAARLFHQPRFNCFIMAMIGSAKRIDVAAVKAGLEVTLLRHPRFSSILVSDRRKCVKQKWVRTKVVLDDHFVVPDLDPDVDSPDKFVEDYASDLSKTPIDMSKPLWEIHILNVRTSEAEATAIFRIHHSLGDGISLISLLLACTRKTSDLNCPPSVLETRKPVSPERRGVLWFVAILWWVMRVGWYTLMDIWAFLVTAVFLKDTVTPLKGGKGTEFNPKRFVHCTFSLDDVKFIKNAMKSTVNDVFLGVTSAGLSRYLNRRYGKDEADNIGEHSLPSNIRLRATVLVNIRATPGIYALHDMMENNKPDVNWGNRLGYVLLPFFMKIQDDVLDHVRKAKAIVDRKKLSLEALFTFFSGNLVVHTIGIKAAAWLCHRVLSNTTLSFSNVAGPMEEISFYGHPVVYLAPSVYGHPQAVTVHFQSYMNKVTLSLAVDENMVSDPHQLCQDLADSLKLIKDAVVTKEVK